MSRGWLLIFLTLLAAVAVVRSGVFASGDGAWPEVEKQHSGSRQPDAAVVATAPEDEAADDEAELPPRRALGQMMVARFEGGKPGPAFLARIKRGKVGGVILFEENLRGGDALADRIQRLQEAAREGGNPPLLVMVDQEGGSVKRLAGPPLSAAAAMTSASAKTEGEATGDLLAGLGIDVDLAPVADVRHPGSFLDSRAFGSQPDEVASLACDFAAGLRSQGVAATLKHFPGLGRATANTDETPVTVDATAGELRADYTPYERCAGEPLTLVMVDSAIYPELTGPDPAVMSPLTYRRELPRAGATGVTISDDLETPAIQNQTTPARRSILAGLDLLLYARTETTSADAYDRLLEDVEAGAIPAAKVEAAAAKVLALKAELGG
ncbi:MAG TPA: glycoside hydrolase family 3 N-terminal domain-containing protein [Solirubrobacterales bacterium]|nr:glycoside hydrolase family 3 N-terminal domain-containing protein [Solirubrobacterales bacterium]